MATTSDVTGLIAENSVNLNNTDLSTQVLSTIFGDGWWNITTGGGDTVIYELLMTLNSCCAVAVAWLMILTVLIASVGSAQEGKSIGGRYASAWVPLRFSFAFAAITPIVKGMCAMQILILACIGVSIDLANKMYETGLNYLARGGAFTAIAPPRVEEVGQQLAAGSLQSQTLISYLRQHGGCEGGLGPASGESLLRADQGDEIVLVYGVPDPLVCSDKLTHALPVTAFGGFRFKRSGNDGLDNARIAAIKTMANRILPVGEKLATLNPNFADTQTVLAAGLSYSGTVTAAASQYVTSSSAEAGKALRDFADVAGTSGWFTLGSYYWTMATAAQNALDRVTDTTQYFAPDFELLQNNLHPSFVSNVRPNLQRIQQGVSLAALQQTASDTVASASNITISEEEGLGIIGRFFRGFAAPPWGLGVNSNMGGVIGSHAAGTAQGIMGSDAILRTVQYARWFTNACTNGMILLESAKILAMGGKATMESNVFAKIGNMFSGGILAGIKEAGVTLISDVWVLGMLALGTLWAFSTFVAFVVPAMPFLIWVAAIVGWIVLSLEAVIAAPVWLVGHAMPEGEGFAGQHGRQGYLLILGILLRPCLLVLSMLVCICIMMATGTLVEALFVPFMKSLEAMGGLGIVGNIFLFVTLAGMVALLTWKIFELITAMPDRIIRWMGHGMQQLGNEAAQANAQDVVGGAKSAAGHTAKAGGIAIALAGSGSSGGKADKKTDEGGGGNDSLLPGNVHASGKEKKDGNREY